MAQIPRPPAYQQPQAYQPPVYQQQPRPKTAMVWIAVAVLVISLLTFAVVYLMLPSEPEQISYRINVQENQIRQGATLALTQSAISFDQGASIKYQVENMVTKEVVYTQSEQYAEDQLLQSSFTIALPDDTPVGRYTVAATLETGGRTIKSSAIIRVLKSATQPAPVEDQTPTGSTSLSCPQGCNDYNACTRDRCDQGQCVHDEYTPCCGNDKCEFGEDANTCPQDCQEETPTPQETVTEIATTQPRGQGSTVCNTLPTTDEVDACLLKLAESDESYEPCLQVVNTQDKDTCLVDAAIDFDQFEACDHIDDRWLQNSCFSYANLKQVEG